MKEQYIEAITSPQVAADGVCLLCRFVSDKEEKNFSVSIDGVSGMADVTPLMDPWLRILIFDMMETGGAWLVKGTASASCLRNMERFAEFWAAVDPDNCQPITLLSERVWDDSDEPTDNGAILPFSGGVDACYSAYRHSHHLAGHKNMEIKGAMMVHGADISLEQAPLFERSLQHNRELLADLGITKMHIIRTNYREIASRRFDWGGHTHMAVLVGLASFLCPLYKNIVIGSSDPYPVAPLKWGDNPVSDYMLASRNFAVHVDDFSKSRTEKAELLTQWPLGMQKLRVCWESAASGTIEHNCGHCEKCVRTNLNFLACGVQLPGMPVLSLNEIAANRGEIHLLREYDTIVAYAKSHNCMEPWVSILEKKIARCRRRMAWPRLAKKVWNRGVRYIAKRKFADMATQQEAWEYRNYIRNNSIPL